MADNDADERAQAQHGTLPLRAYEAIREALAGGVFHPGQSLSVRIISERLDLGTMPTRQAVQRLISERALEHLPNHCLKVPELDEGELRELLQLVSHLEQLAIEKAVQNACDEDVERMREALQTSVSLSKLAERSDALSANMRFWFVVYAASHSPVLIELLERLWLRLGPFLIRRSDSGEGARRQHDIHILSGKRAGLVGDLIEAIAAHDRKKALALLRTINRAVARRIEQG